MKLILKQSVQNLGESGAIVDVKPGYARNYLIPQGLAYAASAANLKRLEQERIDAEERSKHDYREARRRSAQLDGMVLVFRAKAGEEGKLFGSVTTADIADRANAQGLDFELDRRKILLDEPLKQIGSFQVAIRMASDVEAQIEVQVERGDD
jgi:large subunit ribosomal protein L9